MSTRIDIQGKKFGKLTVLSFDKCVNTHAVWNVECECKKKLKVTYSNLISGNTKGCKSCGQKKHGIKSTSFYKRWLTMKTNHPNDICNEWKKFIAFKDDTYESFNESYSLRRLDNTKKYSKSNCYWSVPSGNRNVKNERILFD